MAVDEDAGVQVTVDDVVEAVDFVLITSNKWVSSSHEGSLMEELDIFVTNISHKILINNFVLS